MAITVATFVVIVVVVLGIYWILIERPESREQGELRKRLRGTLGPKAAKRIDFVKQAEKLSAVKSFDALLGRSSALAGSLQSQITRADMKMSVASLLLASACLFLGAWLVIGWLTRLPWFGFGVGAILGFVPYQVVKFKASRRLRLFEEQFPDAIDLIGRALRAGHAFTTGLAIVSEEARQPIAGEFRILYDQQNFGMPLPDALKAFAERIPLLDARFFVTAVLTQRESGGNLSEILANLAHVIRERFKVKRQVRVISAHGRITGWVLSGLPPVLAMAYTITSPAMVTTLINDPLGVKMIVMAVVLQITGTLIVRKLVNIEY
jgi:tight adherence protein B